MATRIHNFSSSDKQRIRNINRNVRKQGGPKRSPSMFHQHYDVVSNLTGNGRHGQTQLCYRKGPRNQSSVVKVINKQNFHLVDRMLRDRYIRAVHDNMLDFGTLRHPNIVSVEGVYDEPDGIHVVSEKIGGQNGERAQSLLDRLSSNEVWSERYIAGIIKQVLRAMDYMHRDNQMVHHDLSPRKILFVTPDDDSTDPLIKITGFGLSTVLPQLLKVDALNQLQEDSYWMAPELLPFRNQNRNKKNRKRSSKRESLGAADMWSVGVILYFLIYGVVPFMEVEEIYNQLRHFKKHFPKDMNVSKEAKSLIKGLMRSNASDRLTARDALRHPWFAKVEQDGNANCDASIIRRYHLSQFHDLTQYKLIIGDMFRSKFKTLKPAHLQDLYRLCLKYDGSGTGVLTSYQFELVLDRMTTMGFFVNIEKLTNVNQHYSFNFAGHFTSFWMRRITTGFPKATDNITSVIQKFLSPVSSGHIKRSAMTRPIGIEYQGFLNSLTHDYLLYHDRELHSAMCKVDEANDGLIETNEALEVFRKMDPLKDREQAMEVADKLENNGNINYDQFLKEIRRQFDVDSLWQPQIFEMPEVGAIGSIEVLDFQRS